MTICNMSIEGGARVGLRESGRGDVRLPARPPLRAGRGRVRRGGRVVAEHGLGSGRDLRRRGDDRCRGNPTDGDVGHQSRASRSYVDERLPRPADVPASDRPSVAEALEFMGCARASRSRARRSTSRSSDRARTRASRTCARLRGWSRAVTSRRTCEALAVPGSQSVRLAAEREGLDRVFIEAGFDWRGAGCSMCLAMNQDRLEGREICASSSNRNFKGRQGSPTGRTLLMSPAMVAAAAVAGEIVDVREIARQWPLRRFVTISGTALPLRGDSIDTDRIIPARFLRSVSFEGLEQHLFEDDRTQADRKRAGTHPISNPRVRRERDAARERELRLRLVARARAAGDQPVGHSRGGRRVVLGDLLRQLRRASVCRA